MSKQDELLGVHPPKSNFIGTWLQFVDTPVTAGKIHRQLSSALSGKDPSLAKWLGNKLFVHHHSDYRIKKLKENFHKLGFAKYAEQHRKLPRSERTKKGNLAEVLLVEYVETCLQKSLVKVYKLKYNPNVDQSLKGDDTLMVDIMGDKKDKVKVYLGEAKFRKTPDKAAITAIATALSKDKRPLSYSFLVEELGKNRETQHIADILDKFIIDEIKGKGDLIYTGFILSNPDTGAIVESNLNSENPNLLMISLGMENPEELVEEAFKHAEYLVVNPS